MKNQITMSTDEAAAALGVSGQTLRRWVASGEIKPANKPNPLLKRQTFLFYREEIEKLAAPRSE